MSGVRGSQEPGFKHRKAQAKASSEVVKFKVASQGPRGTKAHIHAGETWLIAVSELFQAGVGQKPITKELV